MPGYDLHPGVDAAFQFPPEVRAAIVESPELVAEFNEWYASARARANHTGTQLSSTISDFATAVRALAASETAQGTVERATTAEVQALTDAARYISPAGLAQVAVAAATANRIVRRDASGRAQVAAPSAAADIANKGYVDGFETWRDNTLPAFHVGRVSTFAKSGTSSYVPFPWDVVKLNQGGGFDPVLYRFVAPVKGIYLFNCNMNSAIASTGGPQMNWYKNGEDYEIGLIFYSTSYMSAASSLRILLNAGDYIETRIANNNNTSISVDGSRSSFGGHLLAVVP